MAASGGKRTRVYLLAIWFAVLAGLIVFAVAVDDVSPVVYFALYTVAFLGYARYLRRHDNAFMWRHGTAASDGIRVDLGPERIRAVIETELERQGSWDVTGLEVGVDARRGMTVSSFATDCSASGTPRALVSGSRSRPGCRYWPIGGPTSE